MKFKDICSILDEVSLDQLNDGSTILTMVNRVLVEHNESITLADTGLTLIGKYFIWSDEVKVNINDLDFEDSVDLMQLIKEIKQIKYAAEAQRESDNNTKSHLLIFICVIIIALIAFKTHDVYEGIEETTPEANKKLTTVTELLAIEDDE